MTENITRGGLKPATLTNLSDDTVVHFHFNPYEYALSKTNKWKDRAIIGQDAPEVTFESGGAITMSLKLHFDSQASGNDVRGYTMPLWDMMMIDSAAKDPETGKGNPPAVAFEWGKMHFKAIMTSMTEKLTLFGPDGTPLRSEVDVSLQQFVEQDDAGSAERIQVEQLMGTIKAAQLVEGQRLDNVGNGDHREVAEKNNIDNPLNVPPGTTLQA